MNMETIQKQNDALTSENNSLKQVLENEKTEKQVIDQLYCENIRQMVQVRKLLIIFEKQIQQLTLEKTQFQDKLKKIEEEKTS